MISDGARRITERFTRCTTPVDSAPGTRGQRLRDAVATSGYGHWAARRSSMAIKRTFSQPVAAGAAVDARQDVIMVGGERSSSPMASLRGTRSAAAPQGRRRP